ncbi:hypothetical protein NDU88_004326 [Pleurodeles waltl]|uniref:Uncharacterized protein n=1 Tax=Pleurodeles waltl TaxID=8319 RepID=A0AAV7T924_PLEWA|nr:hypothetical protein NDU88_004326 [Pleurodeles waltl]
MEAAAVLALCALAFPHPLHARVLRADEDGFAECSVFFKEQSPPEGFADPSSVRISSGAVQPCPALTAPGAPSYDPHIWRSDCVQLVGRFPVGNGQRPGTRGRAAALTLGQEQQLGLLSLSLWDTPDQTLSVSHTFIKDHLKEHLWL